MRSSLLVLGLSVVGVSVALAACSSSSDDDSGGTAAAGAAGASGGSGGSGASGAGGAAGAGAYTLDTVCAQVMPKVCAMRKDCCAKQGAFDQAGCETYELAQCGKDVAEAKAGTMTFDPTNIDACLAKLAPAVQKCEFALTDYEALTKDLALCNIFAGKKKTGEACERDNQCADGPAGTATSCDEKTKLCATTTFGKLGDACSFKEGATVFCGAGLYCDVDLAAQKTDGTCKTATALGGACDKTKALDLSCALGNYCDKTSGTCVVGKTAGATCATAIDCASVSCDATKKTCNPPDTLVDTQQCTGKPLPATSRAGGAPASPQSTDRSWMSVARASASWEVGDVRRIVLALGAVLPLFVFAACGARTGLRDELPDAGPEPLPTSTGAGGGGQDAGPDVKDAATDPIADQFVPPDGPSVKVDCVDPTVTYVYVVTVDEEMYAFNPATGAYTFLAALACPAEPGATPFSMAVNRTGTAFVLYSSGELFRVSTKNGACQPTAYKPGSLAGFETFGMGFATIEQGPAETLYVAATGMAGGPTGVSALGKIDTQSFKPSKVGDFKPTQVGAELTGTGDGRLFGFVSEPSGNGTRIVQIDKGSAAIVAEVKLPSVSLGQGWAFAFWGGSFYMFTAPGSPRITKYDPSTGEVKVIANLPSVVVGAGVSTCAPE